MKKYIEIGKIVTTHGIKGEIKIEPWCDSPEILAGFKKFYIKNGEDSIKATNSKIMKNMVVAKIKGYDTPEEAVRLRGTVLLVERKNLPLPENTYFITDLIGMQVLDNNDNHRYGEIVDVTSTGANDVYHIKTDDGKILLAPAIADVVNKTDVESNTMLITPLKGLFDDEN